MAKEVTRHIKAKVDRMLWGRAAGRCQFSGCNKQLYKSSVTQESGNIAEKAHIYSFSQNGPRGMGPFLLNKSEINDISNLMLLCHECHKIIDQDTSGSKYSTEILQKWKNSHERRIEIVTGIDPGKKSNVVLYGANIGNASSSLNHTDAMKALFPNWYPATEHPIHLSMKWNRKDKNPDFWQVESKNLCDEYDQNVRPVLARGENPHFSVFALAPIPLLVKLGSLFTDLVNVSTYQLHREPHQTWSWVNDSANQGYKVVRPESFHETPALVLALSDHIDSSRITSVLTTPASIWKLTIDSPNNDFLKTEKQLSEFRKVMRSLIVEIGEKHGKSTPLYIFPAMPVACAVELGRIRMPKADSRWLLYDNMPGVGFVETISIGD